MWTQPQLLVLHALKIWLDIKGNVECKPHNADSNLTYMLNVTFDPDAICPKFDQAVIDIFSCSSNPKDMQRHLYEIIGFIIQPQRFIERWFMWLGGGHNGKTSLAETIKKLVDPNAVYAGRMAGFQNSGFSIGSLKGKLVFIDDDMDAGTRLPDGMLKTLTGNKLLTGELKFKDRFQFMSSVCVLMR